MGVIFVVYLLYSQYSDTPKIKVDTGGDSVGVIGGLGDSNDIGMVGDVGIGSVEVAEFISLNKNREVDRKWGFKKLLHKEGSEWELEAPYMNIYRRNFICQITADGGKVQMETTIGKPAPKDASLVGNVVIHIQPRSSSSVKETFIYLDDIIFISEKAQFSTVGPVKLVSEDILMLGRGLEIVYNDELGRLELLRINNLETLRVKQSPSKTSLLSSQQTDTDGGTSDANQLQTTPPTKPAEDKGYSCLFSKNVVIDAPEQLVVADEIVINNLLFADDSGEKPNETGTVSDVNTKADDVPVISASKPYELPEQQLTDIVITCDDGIYVVPMESPRVKTSVEAHATTVIEIPKDFNDIKNRTTFIAQRIDCDYGESTSSIRASGWSEITFYPDDVMGSATTVPVKITAHKKAEFLPAANQVIFEGDSVCTMTRQEAGIQQKHTLSAPKLTIELSSDKSKQSSKSAPGIRYVVADGGTVKLSTVNMSEGQLLGGVELKCLRFDFDTTEQTFLATGPGIIKVDNSKIPIPKKKRKVSKFGLRKRCYALVDGFETLKYFLESNHVVASSQSQEIHIGYIPIIKGKKEEQVVKATASHIEADLIKTATGQSELSTLIAKGGITYEEEFYKKNIKKKTIQFVGSEFHYDATKGMIYAWGDGAQPCLLNGALVDGIKYNLKSGRIKAAIVGPGTLQMGR